MSRALPLVLAPVLAVGAWLARAAGTVPDERWWLGLAHAGLFASGAGAFAALALERPEERGFAGVQALVFAAAAFLVPARMTVVHGGWLVAAVAVEGALVWRAGRLEHRLPSTRGAATGWLVWTVVAWGLPRLARGASGASELVGVLALALPIVASTSAAWLAHRLRLDALAPREDWPPGLLHPHGPRDLDVAVHEEEERRG